MKKPKFFFEKQKKELINKLERKEKSQFQFNNNFIYIIFISLDESIIYSMICQANHKF